MKQIVIRECAVKAIEALGDSMVYGGGTLLVDICREAFAGEKVDFEGDSYRFCDKRSVAAVYEAIAPDIVASVSDEPATQQIFDGACDAIGQCVAALDE